MPSGPQHYLAAENMLTEAADAAEHLTLIQRALIVNAGLAHATLALAAATALAGDMPAPDSAVWERVAGLDEEKSATVTAIRDRP